MKRRSTFLAVTVLTVVTIVSLALTSVSPALADAATQISGVGVWPADGECIDPEGEGAAYAVKMTGDLEGCLYTFVETFTCSPSGAYNETGTELFIGEYNGSSGTFETDYRFTAKYNNCTDFIEQVGRCQHPLIVDSGRGVFEGMTGRIDMKDDIAAGNFPYRGHLR